MDSSKIQGQIKCFNQMKSFGFISRDKGKDIFFHIKDCLKKESIHEGIIVEFQLCEVDGKTRAVDIERVS